MKLTKLAALGLTCATLVNVNVNADPATDALATTQVKALYAKEADLPANKVHVKTINGVTKLEGVVATRAQANRALELASSVDGVNAIDDSNLKVKSSNQFLKDSALTAVAKGKILRLRTKNIVSPNYDLHVETTNGVVHVHGYMATQSDVDKVVSTLRATKGVKAVRTNVKV